MHFFLRNILVYQKNVVLLHPLSKRGPRLYGASCQLESKALSNGVMVAHLTLDQPV